MKTILKAALGVAMLAGATAAATAPAEARVGVFLNFGGPGYYGPPAPPYYGPPRPYYDDCYGPYFAPRCDYPAYYGPVFYDGFWVNSPRYREFHGRREFWVRNGWHSDVRFRSGGPGHGGPRGGGERGGWHHR